MCGLYLISFANLCTYSYRYCIIDQSKLPHYQHSYDNVDRDEDDEIDISELDFALKTVNYNLITDAEMNYVHSVIIFIENWSVPKSCDILMT